MGGQGSTDPKSLYTPGEAPFTTPVNKLKDPFGGGNVLGNVGADYQTATDNPIGKVWNDTPWGVALGAASTAAQGGNPFSGTPFEGIAGAPPDQKMSANQGAPGALPSLGDIAKQPSPFGSWVTPNGSGGWTLGDGARYQAGTLGGESTNAMDGGLKVDTTALKALQGYATNPDGTLNTSASPWLTMQNANVDLSTGKARNQASLDAQSASDQAMSNAAMHGGITGGGAARISALGTTAGANGQQNATLAGDVQKNQNAATDWTNKLGVASALPGMQQGLAQYNSGNQQFDTNALNNGGMFNAGNIIGGIQSGNSNLLQQYMQAIMGQGGSEMASAMSKAGKHK